jgi:hypothetical protein
MGGRKIKPETRNREPVVSTKQWATMVCDISTGSRLRHLGSSGMSCRELDELETYSSSDIDEL